MQFEKKITFFIVFTLGWIEKGAVMESALFQSIWRKAKYFWAGSCDFSQACYIADSTDFLNPLCFNSLLVFLALFQVKGVVAVSFTSQHAVHLNFSKVSRLRRLLRSSQYHLLWPIGMWWFSHCSSSSSILTQQKRNLHSLGEINYVYKVLYLE